MSNDHYLMFIYLFIYLFILNSILNKIVTEIYKVSSKVAPVCWLILRVHPKKNNGGRWLKLYKSGGPKRSHIG